MSFIRKIGNDTDLDRKLNQDFTTKARTGYVEVGEDNFCLPIYYQDLHETIDKFEVRDDDVFLLAHPKTGTTWLQEMLWLIMNDFDYDSATRDPIYERSPQLEFGVLFDFKHYVDLEYLYKLMVEAKSPRCIKSHLHWSLMPEQIRNGTKQPKIIVILRNPQDSCVSLFYHSQSIEGYRGTFEDFCELFLAGRVCFGPFWKQVLSCWEQRSRPNIIFVQYKDMVKDLPAVIRRVSEFLEKSITEDQITKLSQHLSFESMKKNRMVNLEEPKAELEKKGLSLGSNAFIRAGKVGGYKAAMSPELIERFTSWNKENLAGTELSIE